VWHIKVLPLTSVSVSLAKRHAVTDWFYNCHFFNVRVAKQNAQNQCCSGLYTQRSNDLRVMQSYFYLIRSIPHRVTSAQHFEHSSHHLIIWFFSLVLVITTSFTSDERTITGHCYVRSAYETRWSTIIFQATLSISLPSCLENTIIAEYPLFSSAGCSTCFYRSLEQLCTFCSTTCG